MKNWLFREATTTSPPASWTETLCISPTLLELLWRRGFQSKEDIENFLSSRLNTLTPPKKWPNIPEAAKILVKNLINGKKLLIWGDYDVDGITSTTLVLDVLEFHNIQASYHLPDRKSEGYGLNISKIDDWHQKGCEILLTVDCGISDITAIQHARDLGMTVIVSDHHLPPDTLPNANAICNPRINDNLSPCPNLAGVGVAFYLMAEVNNLLAKHTNKKYKMDNCLDLVALGTLADVMNLLGENRILVRAGLSRLENTNRPGIAALKTVCGFDPASKINSTQVVYRIAPKINAAGRMSNAELGIKLLRAKDHSMAINLANQLDDLNNKRKSEEEYIFFQATEQATQLQAKKNYSSLVLYGKDWHPGIIGIVASRIVELFYKPTVILCDDNNTLKGSARSIPSFDLHAGLSETSEYLLNFGGHKLAAGLRLEPGRLESFREAFDQTAKNMIPKEYILPQLTIECELDFSKAVEQCFLKELDLLQPFGAGNPEPIFASPPLILKDRSPLGYNKENILLRVQDTKSNITLQAKAWKMANIFPPSLVGKTIQIAYTPKIDTYNGIPSVNLDIKDWRFPE